MPNQQIILLFLAFLGLSLSSTAQNDKQVIGDAVFSPSEIAEGVEVMFMIRFQNLGNDTAINIVVRDTLDPRFDANTLTMLDASHPYQLLRDQGFVRWYFTGIELPSALDGLSPENSNSTGFLLFTVQPLRFLGPNQNIQNRACITFDDQGTICTNPATIWIDGNAAAPELGGDHDRKLTIIPNPNYGHFEVRQSTAAPIETDEKITWWISDMNGKTIWDGASHDLAAAPNEVMLERPAPGLYMLWLKDDTRLQVEQFAVIR